MKSVYHQVVHQRHAQIKDTFDAKMARIDKMKASAPTDAKGEAEARANRHKLRVEAATEYCDARRTLNDVYGPYAGTSTKGKK